ncbi:MAG: hypothetical protein HFJ96_07860 [Peptococcaceae bacterium]|jgi:hypothetical protein|nr:hypothetical protein [Peptococcaceae bacterium]
MNTSKISTKKILIPVGLALLLIIAVVCLIRPNLNAPKLPPNELAQTAIDNLLAAESLSFATHSCLLLGDEEMQLGDIHGEINGADFHVAGEVLGTPMDLYQIGAKTYRQDTLTEQWLVLEDQQLLNQEALLNEINPRAAFQLTDILNISETETENLDEEKCYKLSFQPQTASGYYEKYFSSLTYTIWVTLDDHQLRQAQICASASANNIESTLQITTEFWDWNNTPAIEAPVVE